MYCSMSGKGGGGGGIKVLKLNKLNKSVVGLSWEVSESELSGA